MNKFITTTFVVVSTLLVLIVAATMISGQATTGPQVLSERVIGMRSQLRLHPFSTGFPKPEYSLVDGATVSIEAGYAPGKDRLMLDYQGEFDIDAYWDDYHGVLYLQRSAPISEYLDAISQIVFYTDAEDFQPRRITWTLGRHTFYNSLTRHMYRFMQSAGGTTFASAQSACSRMQLFGMQGYLATVTSWEEQALLSAKSNYSMFIGLKMNPNTSAATETWTWVDGPEAGKVAWTGLSMYGNGYPTQGKVEPTYNAWGPFQPESTRFAGSTAYYAVLVQSLYEPVAFWQNKADENNVPGYVCEFGGFDSDPAVQGAMLLRAGTVVLDYSCALFATAADCINRANFGCDWTGVNCRQIGCKAHQAEQACEDDFRCLWNTDVDVSLIGRCVNTRCSTYSNTDACAADPVCYPKPAGSQATQCVEATCNTRTTACACGSLDGCRWDSQECKFEQALGCNHYDIVFLVDATSELAQPFLTFSQGFRGLTDIFLKSQFALTGTSAGAQVPSSVDGQRVGFIRYGESAAVNLRDGGDKITGNYDIMEKHLKWLQGSFSPGASNRNLQQALTLAKSMLADDGSTYGAPPTPRKKVVVIFAAGPITDAVASKGIVSSMALDKVVVLGVALKPTEPGTPASSAAYQSLMSLTAATIAAEMDDVQDAAIYGLCTPTTVFGKRISMTNLDPKIMCSASTTIDGCRQSSPLCAWSFATASCVASQCVKYCDTVTCSMDAACKWYAPSGGAGTGMCLEMCTGNTQGQCSTFISNCFWNTNKNMCEAYSCTNNPDEDACLADPDRCQYNESAVIKCKPPACRGVDPVACDANPHCRLTQSAGCIRNPCAVVRSNYVLCAKNPECFWNENATRCELHSCALLPTEASCNANFNCAWNVSFAPAACMPALCTGLNNLAYADAMTKCNADTANCIWVTAAGGKARCDLRRCDANMRACDCAKMPQCVWRGGQCKDSRYVQCPGIDVVFLVEGSPQMNLAFGRHPNGFIGVMESIRAWSMEAPMTQDATAAGFRLGIVVYGTTALTVPNFNDITGDPAEWLGPNKALDSITSLGVDYGSKAGDLTNINLALDAAASIFTKHAGDAGNRNKLLIVLGSRPITDGTKVTDGAEVMRVKLRQIESMGVHIFTNVLRRFSTITPGDVTSRMYIEPLASDPASVHFLFTTIDDMRKTLLDEFCDPSTNTGKLLKISRDDTLPCSWTDNTRECGMQATCWWNGTARPTCPNAGECPNLGCISLPASLAKKFSCANCQINRGALECSTGQQNLAAPGMCAPATKCLLGCDAASCTPGGACTWNAGSTRCERDWCKSYMDRVNCNGDSGCFWDEIDAPINTCKRSTCWRYRAEGSCLTPQVPDGPSDSRQVCFWVKSTSPAVCQMRHCSSLDISSCSSDSVNCVYNPSQSGRKCRHKQCAYSMPDVCELDNECYWDPYNLVCLRATSDCVISNFSSWSPCTATCGEAIRFRTRKIVQFWSGLPGSSSCPVVLKGMSPAKMAETEKCDATNQPSWQSSCATHCSNLGAGLNDYARMRACMLDKSCQWASGTCEPKPIVTCQTRTPQNVCEQSDLCWWNGVLSFCEPSVSPKCSLTTQTQCSSTESCQWRTGAVANNLASGMGLDDVTLFNPGQHAVFVFPSLSSLSVRAASTNITGATVMIETNYQRDKDFLGLTLPTNRIGANFQPAQGVLQLTGYASILDYFTAISLVTFQTTATAVAPRTITWALNSETFAEGDPAKPIVLSANTVFASVTGHTYTLHSDVTGTGAVVPWTTARDRCASAISHGRKGYLATVTSDGENEVVSSKMLGSGWLGADNSLSGSFRWATGPEAGTSFWAGPSILTGGAPIGGAYSNWLPFVEPQTGPSGSLFAYLDLSGYWYARNTGAATEDSYICEFGGVSGDATVDYPFGGTTIFGVGGCVPVTCQWHATQGLCSADPDCEWQLVKCLPGCQSRSTVSECSSNTRCYWNTDVLPPLCSRNPCGGLGALACDNKPGCIYDLQTGICRIRTGCTALQTEADCNTKSATCKWTASDNQCTTRQCQDLSQISTCLQNPLCEWTITGVCVAVLCKYPDQATCQANAATCKWSDAKAAGAVAVQPNAGSVLIFKDNDDVVIPTDQSGRCNGITVRISEGFHIGSDWLAVKKSADETGSVYFKWTYDEKVGVLVAYYSDASSVTPGVAVQDMMNHIEFSTTSQRDTTRVVDYVLEADAILSPAADPNAPLRQNSYIRYVKTDKPVTTYAAAKALCQSSTAFGGRPGFPATITNMLDNFGLAAIKAQGWLGGVGTSGSWDWTINKVSADGATIETTKDHFWDVKNGAGTPVRRNPVLANAPPLKFAQWVSGQPSPGTAQYAFMNSGGKWAAVVDGTVTLPTGVICQYPIGSAPMGSSRSYGGVTLVKPQMCFALPCKGYNEGPCKTDPMCRWVDLAGKMGRCEVDSFCATTTQPGICSTKFLCYWDFTRGLCRAYSDEICGNKYKTLDTCNAVDGCSWNANLWREDKKQGGCTATGCGVNPAKDTCEADPTCRYFQVDPTVPGICVSAICGYLDPSACWADNKCFWNRTASRCYTSVCLAASDCSVEPTCSSNADGTCTYERCSSKLVLSSGNDAKCLFDPACLVVGGKCTRPPCQNYPDETMCNADKQCFYFTPLSPSDPKPYCGPAQCTNSPDRATCGGDKASDTCRWDAATGTCRQASAEEMTSGKNSCIKEVDGNLWWLWLLLALILILLLLIIWRLYLAYKKGLSFLDPARKNIKFNAAASYAAELFEDAQKHDEGGDFLDGENNNDNNNNNNEGENQAEERDTSLDEL